MKNMTLGMGLLAAGLLAISPVHAEHPHGEHPRNKSVEKNEPKTAQAPVKKITLQTTCPVMGGKINKDLYVDHAGKRVYACCKDCIGKLQKSPAEYIKKLEAEGVTVAKVQTTCPVMGGKINRKQYADVNGKRIYVCCPGCIGTIKADPAKFIKKLEKDGVVLDAPPKPKTQKKSHEAHE